MNISLDREGIIFKNLLLKMKDNIEKAMKCGQIMLSVFVDFSKVFDIVGFNILVQKLHKLHFLKAFLYVIWDYLINRTHFVQIDSSYSFILYSNFGVPQMLILGPVLFNLCFKIA